MNEELQKELLSILRAMKDGSPAAWQALVDQRQVYCLVIWIAAMIGLAFAAFIVVRGASLIKRDKDIDDGEVIFGSIILVIVSGLGLLCGVEGSIKLAEGMAPLGRVLEMLR